MKKEDIENWLEKHDIHNYIISEDLIVTVRGNVNLNEKLKDKVLPVKFDFVEGYFDISNNDLVSLEGCPEKVTKDFNCSKNKLKTLFHAPKSVGDFDCSSNNLENLSYTPLEIKGYFNCSNNQIRDLKGSPRKIIGYFNCSNNKISSLKKGPESVGLNFDCSSNLLNTLTGGPISVGKDYICNDNANLVDLDHIADEIGWDLFTNVRLSHVNNSYDEETKIFKYKGEEAVSHIYKQSVEFDNIDEISTWLREKDIKDFTIRKDNSVDVHSDVKLSNKLNNLLKLPVRFNEIQGSFDVSDNALNSLEGSPRKVNGDFLAYKNEISFLKGGPKEVRGNFIVLQNNILSLKYAPLVVEQDFICSHNPLKDLDGLNVVNGSIFTGVNIEKLNSQKYVYNGVATYKYEGKMVMKYLDKKYVARTDEEQAFEDTRKNMEKVVQEMLSKGELTPEKINDNLLKNLKKYHLEGLKEKLLKIKFPPENEKANSLSKTEIENSIFDKEL